jgi:hypothetical protein
MIGLAIVDNDTFVVSIHRDGSVSQFILKRWELEDLYFDIGVCLQDTEIGNLN